ncbi:hypothetical protein LNQ52_13135 [Klebsiella pneumoniae subsp. pneumoniae]|nr:hypothetical protein [Klebsiella pneumoniae subsp. pneumoniae]
MKEGFFRYGTDSTRENFCPAFQLYPRIDQIDDVGSGKQIASINTRGIRPAISPVISDDYKRK